MAIIWAVFLGRVLSRSQELEEIKLLLLSARVYYRRGGDIFTGNKKWLAKQ
jgi:hypothetical protein